MHDKSEQSGELELLLDQLDELWVCHLGFLDQYQKAQDDLKRLLAAGFFSLTQANFKSSHRRSYGQDYYDERMKASRRCGFPTDGSLLSTEVTIINTSDSTGPAVPTHEETAPEAKQQPSPPATPAVEDSDDAAAEEKGNFTTQDEKQGSHTELAAASRDPLKWFGILVPRELRSTQASFCSVVDGPITCAVNAARGMRETEAEVRKLRKAIKKAERASVES